MWVNRHEWATLKSRVEALENLVSEMRYEAYIIHPSDNSPIAGPYGNYRRMYFSEFFYKVFSPLLEKLGYTITEQRPALKIEEKKGA